MFLFVPISSYFPNYLESQLGSNWGQNKTVSEKPELLGIEKGAVSLGK